MKLKDGPVVVEYIRQINITAIDVPGVRFKLLFNDLKESNLRHPHCHYFPIDERKRSFDEPLLDGLCKVLEKESQEIEVIKH